ncbi:hypothetical protein K5Y32_07195 [Pantoea sp. DY-15]|uniref:hypothetical protein n=1 Tax=Pantoea sp. DY-15 TaxID=2871489 RepID=UPI001C9482E8|nr:hypothetical protein [Pantoea sp. DY-15]MBY4887717.1 hypothetical protein [Pantoea sp. DY-15]
MAKLIKHWNVFITTQASFSHGGDRILVGAQRSPNPNIDAGFLLFENLDGAQSGVNLREVLAFNIEPEFIEEK